MVSKFNADGIEYHINEVMTASGIEAYASVASFREDLDIAHIRPQIYNIPVTEILASAAQNHEYLKELYIPSSVTDIGENAFANCCELRYIHFEGSGDEVILKNEAFCGCEKIISIFGNRLFYLMGEKIFQNCHNMIALPNLSGGIPNNSFTECKKLKTVYITDEIRFCYISEFGLHKSGINTITIFGQAAFAEKAIDYLVKKGVTIRASQTNLVEDLAYSGVFVTNIGK